MTGSSRHLARLGLVLWLTAMWTLLWGSLTPASMVAGLLVSASIVIGFPPARSGDDRVHVRPLALGSLLGWFAWALLITNLRVAREVLVPRSRSKIRTAIVAVPLRTRSGIMTTIIANMITLTPGTLTVDVRGRPGLLFVHVLAFEDAATTRAETWELERRVLSALGSPGERELLGKLPTWGDEHDRDEDLR